MRPKVFVVFLTMFGVGGIRQIQVCLAGSSTGSSD